MGFITKGGTQTAAQTPFTPNPPLTSTNVQDAIEEAATLTAGGTISGPISSTDNAVVRWNGTSGTVIQNSNAILNDDGVLQLLSLLQKDTIPSAVTLTVGSNEVYIIGEELNVEGSLDMGGTIVLV